MDGQKPLSGTPTRRAPRLDGERLLSGLPPLAIESFRRNPRLALPAAPTERMPEEELAANRRIEAARPAADLAGMRALARTFRRRAVPPYQVTARAAMVEALLRGPCRATDRAIVERLMQDPPRHPVWECLNAYLQIVGGLKEGALPAVVLAATSDALRVASRNGDPLGMVDDLRGLRAALQQAVAQARPATRAATSIGEERPAEESPRGSTRSRESQFLTVPEAAKWLLLGERTVWRLISRGDLHATHHGSRVTRIARKELERLAASRGRRRRAPRSRPG